MLTIVLRRTKSSLPSYIIAYRFLAKHSPNAGTKITTIPCISATQPLLLSCRLMTLLILSFHGIHFTMQHCSTLIFFVTWCRYPDSDTAASQSCRISEFVSIYMWTYSCLTACCWKFASKKVAVDGGLIMAFMNNRGLYLTIETRLQIRPSEHAPN